jgi:hypothetical protein
MERRTFIMSSAGVLACAGLGAGGAAAANAAARQAVAGEISAEGFAALLHQPFTLHGQLKRTSVQLAAVSQIPALPGLHQFSLQFSGTQGKDFGSGLYDIEHPRMGRLMVYLDAQTVGGQVLYRADFSLLG